MTEERWMREGGRCRRGKVDEIQGDEEMKEKSTGRWRCK